MVDALKGFFSGHFYKLAEVNGEFTLEIDGVRMHQSSKKKPLEDAKDKVNLFRLKDKVVLDVCTGLGYCALACVKAGAKEVYSIEKDANVLEAAKQNPASKYLFEFGNIKIINEDATKALQKFGDGFFDLVFHDPPRLSFAGELYSLDFYKQLNRVLKKGGKLFHYTGTPGAKSGKGIVRGVKERLAAAGFKRINWVDENIGFTAEK